MKKWKRTLASLLLCVFVTQLMPVTAEAKTVTYWETVKDGVPLRSDYGEEHNIESRIKDEGTVVKSLETGKKWFVNTWHRVQVKSDYTNNGKSGSYWIYEGNLTEHKHTLAKGACTAKGCNYSRDHKEEETFDELLSLEVIKDSAAVREDPFYDGDEMRTVYKGEILMAKGKLVNYKDSLWYQLVSGNYIYSENVQKATAIKADKTNNDIINKKESSGSGSGSGSSSSNKQDFVTTEKKPCTKHQWSMGDCVNCDAIWQLKVMPISGSFRTTVDKAEAKAVPYRDGKVKKTYGAMGSIVEVVGKAENSAGNIWYQTSDGYWIYRVGDVSLTGAHFEEDNHMIMDTDQTYEPSIVYEPINAVVAKQTWSSSNEAVATVSQNGVVRATGKTGKTTITCKIEAAEGSVYEIKMKVTVPDWATLEVWNYDNETFNYDLALECSEYMSLAYPRYTYVEENGKIYVFQGDSTSTKPNGLTTLLRARGMDYKVSSNYTKKTTENSPYVLAEKYVNYNGSAYPVVYVIIEGSAGKAGWQGNMMITGTSYNSKLTEHATFQSSAEDIQKGLHEYIRDKGYYQPPLVVITGHSRGAAVANLLAEMLNHDTNVWDVYAYTFATPNATKDPVACKNIFNICNEMDLVPYIPFSDDGWNYEKHGITYSFDATALYKNNKTFKNIINYQMQLNTNVSRNEPDYNYSSDDPVDIREYAVGKWSTVKEYYAHTTNYVCDMEAYDYFLNGLASAAGMSGFNFKDVEIITEHLHLGSSLSGLVSRCVFNRLSNFFVDNGVAKFNGWAAFNDSHQAFTYHAAMLAKCYNSGSKAHLFSADDELELFSAEEMYGNGTTELNSDEYESLLEFFNQDENTLMLEEEGWDIADPNTWTGILWDMDGHVVRVDLSYMGLTGWLDLSTMTEMQELNIDGNEITMLALGDNDNLTSLSCSSNALSALSVNQCANLENLNCSYNYLGSLDVSEMENLSQLRCYSNNLSSLNLNNAVALSEVRCGRNELTTVDISTNENLNTFYCENNNIIESLNDELVACINAINEAGGDAEIGGQKYNESFSFNEEELAGLTAFANSSRNLSKLGWDLDDPWSWSGVEWKIYGDEYHIASVNLENLDLEGDFNLPDASYLESLSIEGSSLSSLNLAGCTSLNSLNCYDAGIDYLGIEDCTQLSSISCNENFLEVESVESSLNQIGLQTGLVSYETQNIDAEEGMFDENERAELISLASTGSNAEILGWDLDWPGTWDGIVWTKDDEGMFRVNKIDLSDLEVVGDLDLTGFDYLEDFCFAGTELDEVTLPDCVTRIPDNAFYSSGAQVVNLCEGVTTIGEMAFAYCEELRLMVIPTTMSRIMDQAFYGSGLRHTVFLGDEPLECGEDIFMNASSVFEIVYFEGNAWSEESALLSVYAYRVSDVPYLVLLDNGVALTTDDTYSITNSYAGDDIEVTIVTATPGAELMCMLSVYNENGKMASMDMQAVTLESFRNVLTFPDVQIQYISEETCQVKVMLTDAEHGFMPIAENAVRVLIKPSVS